MFKSIKKYIYKAKEEVAKEYNTTSEKTVVIDSEEKTLPKIWTGIDLDGTLAYLDRNSSYGKVGKPVPAMMELVGKMINSGIRIKIFTARAGDPEQIPIIRKWLQDNNLPELEITNVKDYNMQRLYDDRCIQVERNTGRLIVDK
ncbi:MAG: hypothetical protein A2277_07625 [Desulfobacterales bacterium RIFOXYA12_FULL_46_15]|nr:MAG: hypothetical protein A2097_14760 [Desulfobacula sp. GWF2_41_7]OGR28534.1 MAG: hypothetical protein A2277_07625 [Desulfobacterales bacterium RIFOXYA12_FULL_46_15]